MNTSIVVNSKKLVAACEYAKKIIVRNPVVPILENYLLTVKGNSLKVTASDLHTSLTVSVDVVNNGSDFEICLPSESLKYLKKLDSDVTLSVHPESYSIEFLETDGRAKYSGENALNFPRSPKVESYLYSLPVDVVKEFKDLLNYVSKDELRPVMTGINFGSHSGKYYMCATDGHTLKTVNVPELNAYNGMQTDFILPAKPAKIISDSKVSSDLLIYTNDEKTDVLFIFESPIGLTQIITRTIDEKYPEYFNVIPVNNTTFYTFESKVFLKALDKVELFANKTTHQVRLSLNGANKLSAEDLDFSNEACMVTGGTYEGPEIEIGFNAEYLKQAIQSFGDSVTLQMSEPNKAAIIKNDRSLVLVMPVKLHKYA